jgi:excisionase family DNA binding protein
MSTVRIAPVTVSASSKDTLEIKQLEAMLYGATSHPKLVGADGKEIPLPEPVYEVLKRAIYAMASGQAISIVPTDHELTTQEAADLLGMSRPYLIRLLEQGKIQFTKTGSHRRIKSHDLMHYKSQRDVIRRQNLRGLTEFLEEEGFYDYDVEDADCQ